MAALVAWAEGVHLNQSHEAYLEDCGLGYTGIKENLLSPVEWWDSSVYNPNRPPEPQKKAFNDGTALHVHFLDGLRMYERTYAVMPTRATHPDHLETVAELQMACAEHKLSTAGLHAQLVHTLLKAKAPVKIMEVEREKIRRKGKLFIPPEIDRRIRILHRMAMRSPTELRLPEGDHMTLAQAFKNALTEVSVYWVDENGIRQRARFDLLKPNFTGDLKSITDWRKGDFKRGLLREMILRGYMIQKAHYDEARRQLRKAVAEGRVFGGNKTQRKRLEEIARAESWTWLAVFAKMDGAAQVRGIIINSDIKQSEKAVIQREEALTMHLYYKEFFEGYEAAWFDPDVIWEPEDTDWPAFSVEFGDTST